jgi:signal transduction histidine kinase
MLSLRDRLRSPQQLPWIFLAAMTLLSGTLGWLGWEYLKEDAQLAAGRLVERREAAAARVVTALDNRITDIAQDVAALLTTSQPAHVPLPADDAVFVRWTTAETRAWPNDHLLYSLEPFEAPLSPPSSREGHQADELVRAASDQFRAGQSQDALRTFARLATLGAAPVAGMPAVFAGRLGQLAVYERAHDRTNLTNTANAIRRDLADARWSISSATFHYVADEASRWASASTGVAPQRLALTEAVEAIWQDPQSGVRPGEGRVSLSTADGPVIVVWRRSSSTFAAFAADSDFIAQRWIAPLGLNATLFDLAGVRVVGPALANTARPATQVATTTGLPWTIQVFDAGESAVLPAQRSRRQALIGGLLVLQALILVGGWFVGRAVAQEVAVARLQSNFVSAVSHEFRTPLTALYQLSELLVRDRVATESDRRTYYEFIHRESDRLRRLVEGLLDFGRLQSGRMTLKVHDLDIGALVDDVGKDFARSPAAQGHRLHTDGTSAVARVRGDHDALRSVVWNLLENAAKYSPGAEVIHVTVRTSGREVAIAVRDHGVGVPRGEERRIFEQFVRGSTAQDLGVRGTGIGLAMARQLARAHHGDITVESEPGGGSTFVVHLPAIEHSALDEAFV